MSRRTGIWCLIIHWNSPRVAIASQIKNWTDEENCSSAIAIPMRYLGVQISNVERTRFGVAPAAVGVHHHHVGDDDKDNMALIRDYWSRKRTFIETDTAKLEIVH